MLALHAGFTERQLVVWAEASPEAVSIKARRGQHLLDAGPAMLSETLEKLGVQASDFEQRAIWLPTANKKPIPSTTLIAPVPNGEASIQQWQVTTAELAPSATLNFLSLCVNKQVLEPGVTVGIDVAYWSAAMQLAGALVARQQFLPDLMREHGDYVARWRAAFLGRDEDRLCRLAESMPAAARALTPDIASRTLLTAFLDTMVDELVRTTPDILRLIPSGLHERWLAALHSSNSRVDGTTQELQEMAKAVREWRRPIAITSGAPYRLCLRLEEPEPDEDVWKIRYLLQARNDPSLLIPTASVWAAKPGKSPVWSQPGFQPREHLLFSLGQASTICPRIEESLKSPAPEGYELDATGAHAFLTTKAIAMEEAGFGVLLPAWWTRKGGRARLSVKAHVKTPFQSESGLSLDALLDFEWQVLIGGQQITLKELKELAKLKEPLVRFRGQWIQLRPEEIQAALDFWTKKGQGQMTARQAVRVALGAEPPAGPLEFEGLAADGWMADLLQRLEGHCPFEELAQPEGLHATLRPYQVRGYSWLMFLRRWGLGACLADDMGLGKSIQTLSLILRDRTDGTKRPVLLLCPTSVIGNWQKEVEKFTPQLNVMVHHGATRLKAASFVENASEHAIVLSSYALLHRDFDSLKEVPWAGIVLDEAQNIKNSGTRQSAAARALTADYKLALTGTPVENNVGDLWSIIEFLNPGLLGTESEFRRNYFIPIQSERNPEAASKLKRATGPFILRRLKTDTSIISDLPQKLEMKVYCTLTKEQASLYGAVVEESIRAIESAEGIQRKGIVLATLARLKQVCNHPAQFLQDHSQIAGRSGKLARLTEMAEEAIAVGDRVLVFSQFAEMGAMLRTHLQETSGREVLFLHGGVPKKQRDQMVQRFQEEPDGPSVFVLSLKAGGTGLNLTRANHVFHFDRWWNPAVENQATDRAFRIGQKKNVQVHKFVCAGTLEEHIDEMIERKQELAAGIVSAGEGWLTELSTTELKSLFALEKSAVAD